MLNVGRLRVLRELHQRKTLSAVAEALSYSTSAVSQQVRQLEKEVGVRLVEPVGRRIRLTPQGLILADHAEKILGLVEQAQADVATSLEHPRGTVRLAAFQSAALTFVPRALRELQDRYPDLLVEFHQGEPEQTLPALNSGDFDLVIAESYPGIPLPSMPGVAVDTLLEDGLWLAMNASIADSIDPACDIFTQLSGAGWAVEVAASAPRTWVVDECRKHGFEPRIVCASEDLAVQLRFVEAGLAVAVLPGLALEAASTSLRRFPAAPGIQRRRVLLVSREASYSLPASSVVRTALQRASAQFQVGELGR